MHRLVIASVMSGLVFVANTAHAQESGRVGLSMGYPERVDLLWHATERIAIRSGSSQSLATSSKPTQADNCYLPAPNRRRIIRLEALYEVHDGTIHSPR